MVLAGPRGRRPCLKDLESGAPSLSFFRYRVPGCSIGYRLPRLMETALFTIRMARQPLDVPDSKRIMAGFDPESAHWLSNSVRPAGEPLHRSAPQDETGARESEARQSEGEDDD